MLKKKLLPLIMVCFLMISGEAIAASYYVDAEIGNNKNNGRSEKSPWKTLSKVNDRGFKPGDSINFAGTFTEETLVIPSSGKEGSPIVFQQWEGKTPWRIDGNDVISYCILTSSESYIIISKVEIYRAKKTGIFVGGRLKETCINLIEVKSHDNKRHGFICAAYSSRLQVKEVTFQDCESYDNGGAGFHHVGNINEISHYYSTSYNNGKLFPSHGFSSHPMRTQAKGKWKKYKGSIYYNDVGFETIYRVFDGSAKRELEKNSGNYRSLSGGKWDQRKIYVYVNVGENPNEHLLQYTYTQCKNIVYDHCEAYNTVDFNGIEGHGFSFDGMTSDSTAQYCISRDNQGHGFIANTGNNCKFIYSKAYKNKKSGIVYNGYNNEGALFNNTVYQNNQNGIVLGKYVDKIWIYNNIVAHNKGHGVAISSAGTEVKNDYNCFYENGKGSLRGGLLGKKSIKEDPKFINVLDNDFHLQPLSPCIDKGTKVGITTDHDGTSLPHGVGYDMGAFEYISLPEN